MSFVHPTPLMVLVLMIADLRGKVQPGRHDYSRTLSGLKSGLK